MTPASLLFRSPSLYSTSWCSTQGPPTLVSLAVYSDPDVTLVMPTTGTVTHAVVVMCVCGRGGEYTHAVVVLCVCAGGGEYTHAVVVLCVCAGGGEYTHAVVVMCVCGRGYTRAVVVLCVWEGSTHMQW